MTQCVYEHSLGMRMSGHEASNMIGSLEIWKRCHQCLSLHHLISKADTWLSTDASSYELGAALFQRHGESWKPVAYASRAISETEQRYAEIEKEALAFCWACGKFYYYLTGENFAIRTDHKQLVSLIGRRSCLSCYWESSDFSYGWRVSFITGNKLIMIDALSRAPLISRSSVEPENVKPEPSSVLEVVVDQLPISANWLRILQEATSSDEVRSTLVVYSMTSWPSPEQFPIFMKQRYVFRDQLKVVQGLALWGSRVFNLARERKQFLSDAHQSHQVVSESCRKATGVLWWPGSTADVR